MRDVVGEVWKGALGLDLGEFGGQECLDYILVSEEQKLMLGVSSVSQ